MVRVEHQKNNDSKRTKQNLFHYEQVNVLCDAKIYLLVTCKGF